MVANFFNKHRHLPGDDQDFFKDSRMSLGDHIDELRTRMWRAIKALGICLIIGFILDGIGDRLHQPWIGVGIPMLKIITAPVTEQVGEFYRVRNEEAKKKLADARKQAGDAKILQTTALPCKIRSDQFPALFKDPNATEITCTIVVTSSDISIAGQEGADNSDAGKRLQGMGVMEPFMVYFKVSLLCGIVLACPWIFWQMWSFVGVGLYPHEKRLIHIYLPFSIFLFIGGIVLCQVFVMPRAVEAMLGFYKWMDVDPELRLNEWLGFALVMPLVFGISFQTPLVMLFFNRIGLFTWQMYLSKWRFTTFGLALGTAFICPSTDVFSWLCLFIPTFGLYLFGILLCYMMPTPGGSLVPVEEEEVAV